MPQVDLAARARSNGRGLGRRRHQLSGLADEPSDQHAAAAGGLRAGPDQVPGRRRGRGVAGSPNLIARSRRHPRAARPVVGGGSLFPAGRDEFLWRRKRITNSSSRRRPGRRTTCFSVAVDGRAGGDRPAGISDPTPWRSSWVTTDAAAAGYAGQIRLRRRADADGFGRH